MEKRNDSPCKWVNDKKKILGILFGNEITPADNWEPRINKMKHTLNKWKGRNLTLKGKAVIVNTFVGAGLSYLGSVLSCPDEWIKQIDKIIWDFYWGGKPDKIKRDTMRGQPNLGGTGVMNTKLTLNSLKVVNFVHYNRWQMEQIV